MPLLNNNAIQSETFFAILTLLFGASVLTKTSWEEDAELIRRLKAGERRAFTKLVEKYQDLIYTICYRMVQNQEDAEDAAREAFVRSFEKISTLRDGKKYYGWLKQIAIHECHAILRARTKETADPPKTGSSAETPETLLEEQETVCAVRKALEELPETDRDIVELKHFCELRFDEVAELLEIPVNTAKTRFYRALDKLAKRLAYLKG